MPLKRCEINGKAGYKWGDSGKCYTGKDAKQRALKQGAAIGAVANFARNLSSVESDLTLQRAREFWRKKTNIPTEKWDSLSAAEHARAFTTAGLMQADFLQDMRQAMDKAALEGTSYGDFKVSFRDIANQSGWDYHGSEEWRASLIYRQNINTAWNAGRFVRAMETKDRYPYMKRVIGKSVRHRISHVSEAAKPVVYPVDSPYWNGNMPPYFRGKVEFNCACTVDTFTDKEAQAFDVRQGDEFAGDTVVNPGKIEWAESYAQAVQDSSKRFFPELRKAFRDWFANPEYKYNKNTPVYSKKTPAWLYVSMYSWLFSDDKKGISA